MPTSLEVYAFLDRKQDGAFPVFDIEGAVIARIEPSFWNRSFTAYDAAGAVLCTGKPEFLGRTYHVFDAAGQEMFDVRTGFFNSKRRTITLTTGHQLELRGATWPSRDWGINDMQGQEVVSIAATASGWSFHPDAYAVQVADPAITLAHIVGIVEVNRLLVKAARNN